MIQNKNVLKLSVFVLLVLFGPSFLEVSMAGIIVGGPKGNLSLVEVFDYQCPHCRREYWAIQKLIAHNPSLKVDLCPVAILNRLSLIQASSSIAAALSNKTGLNFESLNGAYLRLPFHSEASIYQFMNRLGANTTVLKPLMHSRKVLTILQSDEKLMQTVGAKGVPIILLKQSSHIIAVHIGETSYRVLQEEISHAMVS